MIKVFHSADWHLGAPLSGVPSSVAEALDTLPELAARSCSRNHCDLALLAGDLLDGACSQKTLRELKNALEEMAVPVFISPGNHDPLTADSPWAEDSWPGNVHIFKEFSSVSLPELDCRVYGAPFRGMDCPPLLTDFQADAQESIAIGIFHGDATQPNSPYNPITAAQAAASGLQYLALGHIHKRGQFTAGKTLCAWPGTPMGRGWDETGEKGFLIAHIGPEVYTEFVPSGLPQFHDLEIPATPSAEQALAAVLPGESRDHYRVTLTGRCPPFSPEQLSSGFPGVPNLTLRDRTLPLKDVWDCLGQDSLEGVLFSILKQHHEENDPRALCAAELVRQLLDGEEVPL